MKSIITRSIFICFLFINIIAQGNLALARYIYMPQVKTAINIPEWFPRKYVDTQEDPEEIDGSVSEAMKSIGLLLQASSNEDFMRINVFDVSSPNSDFSEMSLAQLESFSDKFLQDFGENFAFKVAHTTTLQEREIKSVVKEGFYVFPNVKMINGEPELAGLSYKPARYYFIFRNDVGLLLLFWDEYGGPISKTYTDLIVGSIKFLKE